MSSECAADYVTEYPLATSITRGSKKFKSLGFSSNDCQKNHLSMKQEDLINKLVLLSEGLNLRFEQMPNDHPSLQQHLNEVLSYILQVIDEFCMRVPGFDTISREDQITLSKACASEVSLLSTAQKYDIKTDSVVFPNNRRRSREEFHRWIGDADTLYNFYQNMCMLKVNNAEYALLTAITIFSRRPFLLEPKKVQNIKEFYIQVLKSYISTKQPSICNYFQQLLFALSELPIIGSLPSKICFSSDLPTTVRKKRTITPPFPPIIEEMEE